MRNFIIIILFLLIVQPVFAKHKHCEAEYRHAYCVKVNGIEEYKNFDGTRVDCVTDEYAIEFDFANKFYEAIGQSLYYSIITGKKPKIIIIIEDTKGIKYFEKLKKVADQYNINIETITESQLN